MAALLKFVPVQGIAIAAIARRHQACTMTPGPTARRRMAPVRRSDVPRRGISIPPD